jgi:hypothetical protein
MMTRQTWITTLLATFGLAGAALVLHRRLSQPKPPAPAHIRDAGRSEMAMPPRRWSLLDETLDASFPASDPPGNY